MARLGCLATLFVLLYSSALLVSAECPLPNNTQIEIAMRGLPTAGDGSQSLNPTLLEPVHYVCLAQGNMMNTYRSLSVIATYTPSPGESSRTNIFQLMCASGVWVADTTGTPENPHSSVINATTRTDCVQCRTGNGHDRCRACDGDCNTGLRRCTGTSSEGCCLYFDRDDRCTRDNCTVSSGPNYIATASNNFTCTCNLTCPPGHIVNTTSCNECIFTSICNRDRPCKNGGNCIQYSPATNYTCDCTGTGYEGVNCTELIPSPSSTIITATTSSSATTPSPSPPVCSVSNCDDCETSSCCKTCSAGFYLNSDRCSCVPCRVANCSRCRPLNSNCCALGSCEGGYVSHGPDNCWCGAPNSSSTVEPPKPSAAPTDRTGFSSGGLAGLIVGLILGILLLLTLAAVIAYVIYYFVVGGGAGVTKAKSKSPFANGESHNNPLYLAPDEVAAL